MANEQVMKSLTYAYVGRKQKKRNFRQLWITRISAACKMNGMNYSNFMHGLKLAGVEINRKMLAEMAVKRQGRLHRAHRAVQGKAGINTPFIHGPGDPGRVFIKKYSPPERRAVLFSSVLYGGLCVKGCCTG